MSVPRRVINTHGAINTDLCHNQVRDCRPRRKIQIRGIWYILTRGIHRRVTTCRGTNSRHIQHDCRDARRWNDQPRTSQNWHSQRLAGANRTGALIQMINCQPTRTCINNSCRHNRSHLRRRRNHITRDQARPRGRCVPGPRTRDTNRHSMSDVIRRQHIICACFTGERSAVTQPLQPGARWAGRPRPCVGVQCAAHGQRTRHYRDRT